MFWKKKKNKRLDVELRTPKKRKNFFEKKGDVSNDSVFFRAISRVLFFLFSAAVAYVLFLSPFLEIKDISIGGISELDYGAVRKKATDVSGEKYFRFIPKDNLILFPSNKAKDELLENFKKIKSVEISKIFPDRVRIEIVERKSLLVWCSAGQCYIIDENGYAYSNADFESEEIRQNNLIAVTDNSAKSVVLGERILDENYMRFSASLKDEFERASGIRITEEYQTQSRIAEEIRVKTESGWEIYFSTSLPMDGSIQTLKTFLEKEMDEEKMKKLEYVDLRAENKVYYKFRDEEQQDNEEVKEDEETEQAPQQEAKKDDKKKKN